MHAPLECPAPPQTPHISSPPPCGQSTPPVRHGVRALTPQSNGTPPTSDSSLEHRGGAISLTERPSPFSTDGENDAAIRAAESAAARKKPMFTSKTSDCEAPQPPAPLSGAAGRAFFVLSRSIQSASARPVPAGPARRRLPPPKERAGPAARQRTVSHFYYIPPVHPFQPLVAKSPLFE